MFMDGMVVPELLRLLHEARTSYSSVDYICTQLNEASCTWTMRLAAPRQIGWRMTATEEERQRYGQVASLPEIKELWDLYTQLGDIVQYWLHEHLALDALALLIIVWQARENTHHRRLLLAAEMRNEMWRHYQLLRAAAGQTGPTNAGGSGGMCTPLHKPPPPSLPPQAATEQETEEKRTQPGEAELARQPPPPPPPPPPPAPPPQAKIGDVATGIVKDGRREGTTIDQGASGAMSAAQPPPPPAVPTPRVPAQPAPQTLTHDVATGSKGRQTGGPLNEERPLPPLSLPQAQIGDVATGTEDDKRQERQGTKNP